MLNARPGRLLSPRLLSAIVAAAACTAPAFAQAPPSPHTPTPPTATQPTQQGCAQSQLQVTPPQKQGSNSKDNAPSTTGNAPLSDRLAKSGGVLCPPPGIDPEIHAPAPNVGRMPVIPPPGSPGGNPNVQPK